MTLKELQQMIKEELDTYMNEENVSEEATEEAMAVNVDADDVDADGDMKGGDSEDLLRKIFDMLKEQLKMQLNNQKTLLMLLKVKKDGDVNPLIDVKLIITLKK